MVQYLGNEQNWDSFQAQRLELFYIVPGISPDCNLIFQLIFQMMINQNVHRTFDAVR